MLDPHPLTGGITVADNRLTITGSADVTKTLKFEVDGQTAGADFVINAGAQTADRTLNIPVLTGTDTLVTVALGKSQLGLPASTTALAIAKFSDTAGTIVNSGVTIDGSNNVAGVAALTVGNGLIVSAGTTAVQALTATSVTASGVLTLTGTAGVTKQASSISGTTTAAAWHRVTSTGADLFYGVEDSVGGFAITGSLAYSAFLSTVGATALELGTNGASRLRINSAGEVTIRPVTGTNLTLASASATALSCAGGIVSTSPTAGIGYSTGAGSAVAQITSKSTGVTLNTVCGAITLNAASLAASTGVGFTLTNSAIAASDGVYVNIKSGATADSYTVTVDACAAGSCRISLRNLSAGALAEAVVLTFVVIKAVTA